MKANEKTANHPSGVVPRRSVSASASRRSELQRLARLSVEQRILSALSLRGQFAGLRASPLSR
ncbi:MAG: hypothetical protein EBY83_08685 [Verrucomicrobia bacterium]|nr:hypothetical protein [Verrucomicrobiota bacterium]